MTYKSTAKLITLVFATLIVAQTFGFLFLNIANQPAAADIPFTPNTPLPGMSNSMTIDESSIGNYVKTIYNYAIGSVGILSTVVMTFGGILWITAAGNTSRIEKAKATIAASLTGLILAMSSYFLLSMVNPDLLRFEPLEVAGIEGHEAASGCCAVERGICTNSSFKECGGFGGSFYVNYSCNGESCVLLLDTSAIIGEEVETCDNGNCFSACRSSGYDTGSCVINQCRCDNGPSDNYLRELRNCHDFETNCDVSCRSLWYESGRCTDNNTCACTNCLDTLMCPKN